MVAAWFGAGLLVRIDAHSLTRRIAVLLAAIGLLLLVEAVAGEARCTSAQPRGGWWRPIAGAFAGTVIGLVSSLLGGAGGEVISLRHTLSGSRHST